jgi:hypothetical protein
MFMSERARPALDGVALPVLDGPDVLDPLMLDPLMLGVLLLEPLVEGVVVLLLVPDVELSGVAEELPPELFRFDEPLVLDAPFVLG